MKSFDFLLVSFAGLLAASGALGVGCATSVNNPDGNSAASTSGSGGGGDGGGSVAGAGGMGAGGMGAGGVPTGGGGMPAGAGGAGGASGGAGGGGGGSPECVTVADCRLYSSDCGSCVCLALSTNEPDPICNDEPVNCFVDPCEGHNPLCNKTTGQCVVD